MIFLASLCASCIVAVIVRNALPTYGKLSNKLSPYDAVARVRIDDSYIPHESKRLSHSSFALHEILRPMLESVISFFSALSIFDDDETLRIKLQQAGLDTDLDSYKFAVLKKTLIGIAIGFLLGAGIGSAVALISFPLLLGFTALSKSRSALDGKIEHRKRTIRLEMYTIDQLLALHIRTGAGVNQALQSISKRTHGIIAQECTTILSRTRSGLPLDESLRIAARESPEPHAQRTYKLLAATSQRGADLTKGLLDLAHDLRRSLREDIKATSAKRRAAMLIPTIGILAPIMLLFVAAPIPSIVLGGQ